MDWTSQEERQRARVRYCVPHAIHHVYGREVIALLDALEQAERERDSLARRLAKDFEERYPARIREMERELDEWTSNAENQAGLTQSALQQLAEALDELASLREKVHEMGEEHSRHPTCETCRHDEGGSSGL